MVENSNLLHSLGKRLVRVTSRFPRICFFLLKLRHWASGVDEPFPNELLCQRGTELVIEGYPRSGNSFALAAWQMAHEENRPLAHHLHSASQAVRAYQLGIPSLILIRDPLDAVASNIVRGPQLRVEDALRDYITFYRTILSLPVGAISLATFEEVTTDFGAVIMRTNKLFSTSFALFEHSADNQDRCFKNMENWTAVREGAAAVDAGSGAPSQAREGKLAELRDHITTGPNHQLLQIAMETKDQVLEKFRPELGG